MELSLSETQAGQLAQNGNFELDRREKTFGMIPKVVADDPRLSGFISGSVKLDGFAATTGAVIDQDNENIHGKLATRPLLIPVAIDTHGCIDTGIA